jgi:4-aminobutyrate aminotransferase
MSAVYHLPEPVQPEVEPTQAEWLSRDRAALAGVLPRYFDVVAVRGQGAWLWDADGKRYLDFGSGIAVTNTGHCHPKVVAAITEQAATLLHTSVVCHPTGMIRLAERLAGLVPFLAEPQVFFCNSGAEAVDGSLKLARKATGRPGVICFRRAFHGRTLAATSLTTAKGKYREGYEPLLPSITVAPYGDLAGLDELLSLQAPAGNVGAMIVEPVLGEGGYVVPPREFLEYWRAFCDEHGALLVFDEVQSGIGRTGEMFAANAFGVVPDVTLVAKGLASGMPIGAIIAKESVMSWEQGSHGSTFAGNPVCCAAALATLDLIEGGLAQNATRVGEVLMGGLLELQAKHEVIGDVRGLGLMIGIEFVRDRATKAPFTEFVPQLELEAFKRGLLLLGCGRSTIRLAPPLIIDEEDVAIALHILDESLEALTLAVA